MRVVGLSRYPVKSMLGERLEAARLGPSGLAADRELALVDDETGHVATAKHPRLWRRLLTYTASTSGDRVEVRSPEGWSLGADDPELAVRLSTALGRAVHVAAQRTPGAVVERPDPEYVLAHGVEAEVPAPTLEISQGTTGARFVDYAPVHLITTATLEHLGVETLRYRPNLVLATEPGTPAFVENDWVGREIGIGDGVVLRVVLPTPRCSVPTLEHGDLPRSPQAVRPLMTDNRVDVEGFGVLPCAGAYAEVVADGTVRLDDTAVIG